MLLPIIMYLQFQTVEWLYSDFYFKVDFLLTSQSCKPKEKKLHFVTEQDQTTK